MNTKLISGFCACAFGGCAMMSPLPSPQETWRQSTGQIQSSGGKTQIVGEITIRHDADDFLAEVTKGPGLPLLRIYAKGAHPSEVTVRGALARGGWTGEPSRAPIGLEAWATLPEAFHWAEAQAAGDRTFAFSIPDVRRVDRKVGDRLVRLEIQRGVEKITLHLDR